MRPEIFSDKFIFFSVKQVSEILGISTPTIYRYMKDGKIEHSQYGSIKLITRESMVKFLKRYEDGRYYLDDEDNLIDRLSDD